MEEEFVPYEQASALKEVGFNEPCCAYRSVGNLEDFFEEEWFEWNDTGDNHVAYPLYQQAFRWFREKYSLLSEIGLRDREDLSTWKYEITVIGKYDMKHNSTSYNTYEEAELECLKKLIEIVKEKKV